METSSLTEHQRSPTLVGNFGTRLQRIHGNYKSVFTNLQQQAESFGSKYSVSRDIIEVLKKDPKPDFRPWGVGFAYSILIAFLITQSFQFIDIFHAQNTPLILGFTVARLVITIGVVVMSGLSVFNGWRTVPINLTVQIIILLCSIVVSTSAAVSRLIVKYNNSDTVWGYSDYIGLGLPILQIMTAGIGLGVLSWNKYSGCLNGSVAMLTIFLTTIVSVVLTGMSVVRLI